MTTFLSFVLTQARSHEYTLLASSYECITIFKELNIFGCHILQRLNAFEAFKKHSTYLLDSVWMADDQLASVEEKIQNIVFVFDPVH